MKRIAIPLIVLVLVLVAVGVLAVLAWIPVRGILSFRADYPGEVFFFGHADGAFGTKYHTIYMWRDAADPSPLPDVAVYLKGTRYALSGLSDELMQSMGGTAHQGGFIDSANCDFQYWFEDGRLIYFALYPSSYAPSSRASSPIVSVSMPDLIYIQIGDGPPFTLPVSEAQLKSYAGEPLNESAGLAI